MNPSRRPPLLLLLLWLPAFGAQALSSDRDQTLTLQADYVELDGSQGSSHYKGHVVLKQGSLYLEAERLSLYKGARAIERVEASGQPVHFRQTPDGKREPISGYAQQIRYDTRAGLLILKGEARVEQGQDTFSGEEIRYDTQKSLVQASGNDDGKQRVHAIIHPRTPEDEQPASPGQP